MKSIQKDKLHRKIMDTRKRLLDEEDFEPDEATKYAVKKRRFLIQKATNTLSDVGEGSDESEEEEGEEAADETV